MGQKFPPGWDRDRVQMVLDHYCAQSEDAALADDQAAFRTPGQTVMFVPSELVPAIRKLIAKHGK